jgi:hypothetical protein
MGVPDPLAQFQALQSILERLEIPDSALNRDSCADDLQFGIRVSSQLGRSVLAREGRRLYELAFVTSDTPVERNRTLLIEYIETLIDALFMRYPTLEKTILAKCHPVPSASNRGNVKRIGYRDRAQAVMQAARANFGANVTYDVALKWAREQPARFGKLPPKVESFKRYFRA